MKLETQADRDACRWPYFSVYVAGMHYGDYTTKPEADAAYREARNRYDNTKG